LIRTVITPAGLKKPCSAADLGMLQIFWPATAGQVLNHVMPALANVKPAVQVEVEYLPESRSPQT